MRRPPRHTAHRGTPHRVVVLALNGVVAFELGLPHRFLAAGALREGWPGRPTGPAPYAVSYVTPDDQPVVTSAGYAITPTAPHADLAEADTVVIPGLVDHPVVRTGELSSTEQAVLDLVPADARRVSICTGAFVLAARGELDGRRCTTHWMHAERMARLFPRVDVDPDVLFVDHGDLLTSAGNAAGIDVLLHVLRTDLGAAPAAHVARSCVVAPWRDGGQAQFIERPVPVAAEGATAATREWALQHLDEPLPLAAMAAHAGLSIRHFTRAFRSETGSTAGDWLLRARVDRARHLLESTDWPIDRVASRSGLGSGASLRAHFRAQVGLSPSAYRQRFVAGAVDDAAGRTSLTRAG